MPKDYTCKYAKNYIFFKDQIQQFVTDSPMVFRNLPIRILYNCILLPIEAESQDTALRIFSTLNDRGMPLSDSDIFKAKFYRYFSDRGQKDAFIDKWKELEALAERIFHPQSGVPMDELFTRYMYYLRAKEGNKKSTTEGLRKFFERNHYALLQSDEAFEDLEIIADFWNKVENRDEMFSNRIIKDLTILKFAPNSMWTYLVTTYFMANKDVNNQLEEEKFYDFLNKIIGFIWAYQITRPGIKQLRGAVYPEMIKIVNNENIDFENHLFDESNLRNSFHNFWFSNGRPITKSILAWWMFNHENQPITEIDQVFEIEHIYAKKRFENERSLSNRNKIESIGNKALLEKGINIRASDYRFEDKKKYYNGYTTTSGIVKKATINQELHSLTSKDKFDESDIDNRESTILNAFIKYLRDNSLIKEF